MVLGPTSAIYLWSAAQNGQSRLFIAFKAAKYRYVYLQLLVLEVEPYTHFFSTSQIMLNVNASKMFLQIMLKRSVFIVH